MRKVILLRQLARREGNLDIVGDVFSNLFSMSVTSNQPIIELIQEAPMRQLFMSLSLLTLIAVSAKPALAHPTEFRFNVAQGFHFNPASHASVGYLTTLCEQPGDIEVKKPDGTTAKVGMVLEGVSLSRNAYGIGTAGLQGRVSAATRERFKNANMPGAVGSLSFVLECWAYDATAKRYYKTLSSQSATMLGIVPGDRPRVQSIRHRVSNHVAIDLSPAGDVTSPTNHSFGFLVEFVTPFSLEIATSSTYKEIVSWGGRP
jgi:hypothetical protein